MVTFVPAAGMSRVSSKLPMAFLVFPKSTSPSAVLHASRQMRKSARSNVAGRATEGREGVNVTKRDASGWRRGRVRHAHRPDIPTNSSNASVHRGAYPESAVRKGAVSPWPCSASSRCAAGVETMMAMP